jgi:GNAT superfamily N-acetyltransferase
MSSDHDLLAHVTHADLAPGERRARGFDSRELDVHVITSPSDPLFHVAYEHLWREFGAKDEMEAVDVIARRLAWDPAKTVRSGGFGSHLLYQMILARDANGSVAAVRDHTAILRRDGEPPLVVTHLSHLLIAPPYRGSGIAGWMRAWPIATAAQCAVAATGSVARVPVILVAEMEHPVPNNPEKMSRLIAYEKAGFRKIDPAGVDYLQPDFRDAAAIDADGVRPLPMSLVVRRVGHEAEATITGAEVRRVIAALYSMYGVDFREADMAIVYDHMRSLPADHATVALVPPTSSR